MRSNEIITFRVRPGILQALKKMQGPNESMRLTIEHLLMGYLNSQSAYWSKEFRRANDDLVKSLAFQEQQLEHFDSMDEMAKQTFEMTKKVIEQEKGNLATAKRELARYQDLFETAFPNMSVDETRDDE